MSVKELSSLESSCSRDGPPNNDRNVNGSFKKCLKSSCHVRKVNNQGANVIIALNYLVIGIYFYIKYIGSREFNSVIYHAAQVVSGLTLPILGWLADVHIGRYKVISCSLCIMWVSTLFLTGAFIVKELINFNHIDKIIMVMLACMSIGYGGFQANILQFGNDQLFDSSAEETKAYIIWLCWSEISGEMVQYYTLKCVKNDLVTPFIICCYLTIALILSISFKRSLIKEPTTQNPFKLVYKVISYAIKHKHPRQRSAFTYCEDEIPSRIDFGKSKYGGPFTTEQVEDVKTFFRVLSVIAIASLIFVLSENWTSSKSKFHSLFRNEDNIQSFSECSYDYLITGIYFISGTAIIPLYELIFYPLFRKCLPITQSIIKFTLGSFLALARQTIKLVLVIMARKRYYNIVNIGNNSSNVTLECALNESVGVLGTYIDYRWTALHEIMNAASDLMMMIGGLEFLSAQVPYSMKGLVVGITYSFIIVYMAGYSTIEIVYASKSFKWGTGVISCSFWYCLTILSLLIIAVIISIIVVKCYKKRKREDVLPNEHIFAERYYSY